MKKALITGISGFAGGYLAAQLLKNDNYELVGTYTSAKSHDNLDSKIKLVQVNLQEEKSVSDLITSEKPDYIFHLAALASPKNSFDNPTETFTNNILMQINVLEAVRKFLPSVKLLTISSAEVYGKVAEEDLPIDEETPFNPTNPYAVSKLAQDYITYQYYLSNKLDVVRVRPFNHIGPRQSLSFVVAEFAKRIADIEKGKENTMKVGNLKTKRDFTDVRDMVRAYEMAMEKGEAGEVYNIGSGKCYLISDILNKLISLSNKKIEVVEDANLLRPNDNPELLCDYSKFHKLTGWEPEIPIEKTLQDTLDYWRNQD